ncbi:MAG: Ig-like domain-containing protein [Mobilitalea sp.]
MNITRKLGFTFLLSFLFAIAVFSFTESSVKASSVVLPSDYYFTFGNAKIQDGSDYEMKISNVYPNLAINGIGWDSSKSVTWTSSEEGVVSFTNAPSTYPSNYIKMVREGPGYSTVTAIISQLGSTISISCVVKVDLEFNYQKSGLITATTTKERILILNTLNQKKQVFLQYVDYTPTGEVIAVSGSAIASSAVKWESENDGVATVDESGFVTAVGSGTTTITVNSATMSSLGKSMAITMKVVVKPTFSLTYDDAAMVHHVVNSEEDTDLPVPAVGVPSNFKIESNATKATNLKWEVYDSSTKKKLTAGTSSKMTYAVSSLSGNVTFNNVKAGTYEIYAFADEGYNVNTNAPYAYMKVIVPIDVGAKNIIMTVGDTYSILENSNIPGADIFGYDYIVGNQNIADIDADSTVTAKRKGNVTIRLTYKTPQNLYDPNVIIPFIDVNITVVDGIALSTTSETLFTKGTLLLKALVTDPTMPIIWTTSDAGIATVVDGLVTGVKAGIATITAKQTINGIVKKATCIITIQQSVSTIVVAPALITLPIGGFQTLHATITPANLSDITLRWKSSNDKIVTIVESSAMTATIQGVAGGNAVISAINQDNVVVGYCHVSVQQSVISVVLSETEVTVDLSNKRLQLRATASPENALNKEIIWSSTDPSKAKVDQNGLVTLLKPGTVSIIATSEDNAKAKAICNLNILIPVVSIALDETSKIMYAGQSARLSYVILPSNASTNTVTWTSTNASVVAVDATGKVSAKGVGSAVIILKTLDGGYSVYCTITVKRVATSVKFDVSELALKTGAFYYIKTTLTPKDSTDNGLVWESSDTKVAIVDEDGKVVARDAGTAIIMARTEAGGIAYCKVTVTQPVDGLILNFSEKTVFIGDEFKLKVSVSPSSATQLGVTWKSSNPKVAKVSADGEVSGLIGGVAVITCTTKDGGYSATSVITVREAVTTIKLDYETYSLGINKTVTLKATVTTETATNPKVTWTSSNTKVLTVNKKGKVTGIKIGYATITATAQDGSEVEATCEIRVVTPVGSITVDKAYMAMLVGDSKPLKVTIRPSNSTYRKAKWTSSDESIAIVDEDGVVTALKAGSTTIIAEAKDNSGKKAICYVAVRDRLPSTGITLMDKKLTMVPGEEKAVQVVLNPAASTDSFSWSTDNAAVAKVDKRTGKITARATGTANVTVMTDSGKTAVIEVTVIGLNMNQLVLEQYTTYPYPLEVEGAATTVRWSIDNPQVAVVTNGRVSSRAAGTATITALVNGRKLTCKLRVVAIK